MLKTEPSLHPRNSSPPDNFRKLIKTKTNKLFYSLQHIAYYYDLKKYLLDLS